VQNGVVGFVEPPAFEVVALYSAAAIISWSAREIAADKAPPASMQRTGRREMARPDVFVECYLRSTSIAPRDCVRLL
jgi:hypothetical protein